LVESDTVICSDEFTPEFVPLCNLFRLSVLSLKMQYVKKKKWKPGFIII